MVNVLRTLSSSLSLSSSSYFPPNSLNLLFTVYANLYFTHNIIHSMYRPHEPIRSFTDTHLGSCRSPWKFGPCQDEHLAPREVGVPPLDRPFEVFKSFLMSCRGSSEGAQTCS